MKHYLPLLLILLWALTACGGADAPAEPPLELQLIVATDDFAVGPTRVPFVIYSGVDKVADAQAVTIYLYELGGDEPELVWEGAAVGYNDYEVPYWTIALNLPRAGYWGLGAEITMADGRQATGQLAIEAQERPLGPAVGSRPPASLNRTLESEPDISRLTSDFNTPDPALYQMTVVEAMSSGRPTVVTFTTPAFCATQICAPVLESVKQARQQLGDSVNFIHIEVYQEFEPLVLADEILQWGLTSEPWTFVLDSDGLVTARLGGPLALSELLTAVAPLQ
jgi:hypothetical protein